MKQLRDVARGESMLCLANQEEDLVLNPQPDREPVPEDENWSNEVINSLTFDVLSAVDFKIRSAANRVP